MAKGKNSFDLDDELDFGDDFDLFNDEPLNLTRIQKTGATAKGVGLGIRDAVFSVDWLVKTLDNAIPKSYGIDLTKVIDVKDSINELYNDAKEEASKVNKEFKRTTREYSKSIIDHAPNRFKEKLEDYYRESEQRARVEVSEEDGFVTSGLMEMMTAQYAQSAEYHEEERDRQSKEAIVENQHRRQILGINESVRDNLERIASFNDRVTSNYQRNNLKLGLKQYFVLSKILEINRENARVTQDNLDAIYKEVAKPDLLKQKEHPDAQRYFARENRKGGMFGKAYDVVDRIRENALSMGKEKIQNISQATLASLGMLDMMSGMSSMGDMGNKYENYGRVAGEFLGGHLSNPISRAIRKRLERSPRSQELAKRSRFLTSNFRNLIEEESRVEDEWGDYGPKFNPRRLLARTLKGLLKDDTDSRSIERDDERTLQDAHPYTRQTHRTLNEVIPGLLSNIHGELVHMRTGKAISPLTFDFKSNRFTSKDEARERLKGDLYLETGGDRVRQQTDSLLNQIGADNLSESDREDLAVFLMSQSRDRRLGSEERLTDVDTYTDMDPEKAAQYANLFKTYFNDTDDKATRKFEFTDRYNRLMDSSTASRDYFNDLIRTGRSDDLESLGIIHNGRINDEALMRHYLTQDDDDIHIETREKIDAQRKEEEERERRKQEEIEGMTRHINKAKEKFYDTRLGRRVRGAFTKTGDVVEGLTDRALNKVEEVTSSDEFKDLKDKYTKRETYTNLKDTLAKKVQRKETSDDLKESTAQSDTLFKDSVFARASDAQRALTKAEVLEKIKGYRLSQLEINTLLANLNIGDKDALSTSQDIEEDTKEETDRDVKDPTVRSRVNRVISRIQKRADSAKTDRGIDDVESRFDGDDDLLTNRFNEGNQEVHDPEAIDAGSEYVTNKTSTISDRLEGILRILKTTKEKDASSMPQDTEGDTDHDVKDPTVRARVNRIKSRIKKRVDSAKTDRGIDEVESRFDGDDDLLTNRFNEGKRETYDPEAIDAGSEYVADETATMSDRLSERLEGILRVLKTTHEYTKEKDEKEAKKAEGPRVGSFDWLRSQRKDGKKEPKFHGNKKHDEKDSSAGILKRGLGAIFSLGKKLLGGIGSTITGLVTSIFGNTLGGLVAAAGGALIKGAGGLLGAGAKALGGGIGRLLGMGGKGAAKGLGRIFGSVFNPAAGAGRAAKTGGFMGRILGGMGRGIGSVAKRIPGLGKGRAARGAGRLLGRVFNPVAGVGRAMGTVGTMGGLLKTGGVAAGKLAWGGLSMAGKAALPFLSGALANPFVLGAAAVGVGGYAAYKWFTRVTLNPLNQMRLVQYGFDAEDLDTLKKLMVIEEAFKPGVVFDGTGMPTIDDKVVDWQEIVKVTGINAQSEEELQALSNYLDHRFLPVYLVHASVRHRLEGDHDLKNVEKIDKEKIEVYVEGTAFSQGAYPTAYNPFDLPEVTVTNAEDVQYAVEAARAYATELANKKSLKEKAKDSVKGIGRGIKDGVKGIGGGIKGFFLGKEAQAAELVDPGEDLSKNPYLNPSLDDAETREATDKELDSQVGELVKVESGKKIPNFLKNVIKYSPAGLGIKAGGMIMERLKDTDITNLAKTALEYSPLGIANKVRNRITKLVEKSSTLSTIAGIADKVSPYGLAKRGLGAVSDRLKDTAFGRAAGEFKEGISETSIGRGIGNFFKNAKQFVVEGVTGKHRRIPKEIQALDAIRYKLYGLVTMEPNKLYQILDLEDYLDAGLRYGTERRAIWEGSIEEVVSIFSTQFSIDETDKERLSNLATWISSRFLPVFTSLKGFLNDVARTTKIEEGVLKLNPLEKMELVRHLLSVTTILPDTGDVSSVWGITESPWVNYELNTDASSVLTNVNVIESALRDYTVMEEKETKAKETERRKENKEGSGHIQINDVAKRNVYSSMEGNEVITTGSYSAASRENALLQSAGVSAPMIQTGSYVMSEGVGGRAAELPDPVGDGSYDAYKDLIREAAKMAGVDEKTLAAMIAIESGFKARAKAPTSTAKGLGQFLDGTWTHVVSNYGAKYGIGKAVSQYDPKASVLMTAEYIKENMRSLGKKEYRPVDAYMAHFLGAGGYKKFLEAGNDAIGVQVNPDAANSNRSIFYNRDGSPKKVGEIIGHFNNKLVTRAEDFGVNMRESVTTEPVPHNDVSGTVSKEMDGSNAMSRVTTEPVTPGVIGAAQAVAQATGAIFTNLNPYNTSTFTSSHQQNQRNQSAGGGIGGPISGKGIAGSTKDAKSFIETLDPKLIELGKRSTYPADSGVDIQGMNQDFMTIFYALVGEYVQKGGGKIQVNSAYRSVEKQRELYDRWIANGKSGGAVAKPGRSRHGSGIAIDINSKPANTMDSMGLLAKYQFHRPVRGEAWHLENYLFSNAKQTQDAINAAMKDSTKPKPSLVEEVEGGQALPDFKESDLLATPDEISASQSAHAPANAFGGLSDGSSGLRATPSLTGISLDAAEQLDLQHQAAANHPLQRVVGNGLEVAKQQLSVQQDIYGLMREMLTVMSERQAESSVSQSSKEAHDTRKLPGDDTARGRVRDDYIPIGELPKPTVRMNRNI